jgi:hypothetical protein
MAIVPDAKDWTWVLQRPCPECGLDTSSFAREGIPAMIRANAAAWREPLGSPDVVRRPLPDKWSALEYGCHVRDVLKLYDYRLSLMLTEDNPRFDRVSEAQWDRPGRRGDGAVFTVESFARYFVHDPVHHLYDVTGTRQA